MIVEVHDDCIYRDYVYLVPVIVPVQPPRFVADERQRLIEEYQNALIPPNFKRMRPLDMPTRSLVDLGWGREIDYNENRVVLTLWLNPNEYTAAKEVKKLGTFRYSALDSRENEVQRQILSDVLRGQA